MYIERKRNRNKNERQISAPSRMDLPNFMLSSGCQNKKGYPNIGKQDGSRNHSSNRDPPKSYIVSSTTQQ